MAERSTTEDVFDRMSDPAIRKRIPTKTQTMWLVTYLMLVIAVLASGIVIRTMRTTPDAFAPSLDVDTLVYDRFGTEVARFHPEDNLVPVTLEQMSPILIDAALVALDPRYLDRTEINPWPLFAAVLTASEGDKRFTITQRLVKVINGPAVTRTVALREASTVIHLEQTLPREALLEQYLSQVPLGRSTFGVEAASRAWYGRSASNLEIGQAAHLAGLMIGIGFEEGSTSGRNQILASLYQHGRITKEELVTQRNLPLEELLLPPRDEIATNPVSPDAGLTPFLGKVYNRVVDQSGSGPLIKGRIKVDSTLDLETQRAVAMIARMTADELGLSEIAVVALDDRSHIRVMYTTDASLAETARINSEEVLELFRPWETFGAALNWPVQITALQLAEGHALIAQRGRRYETQTLISIRSVEGDELHRVNSQSSVVFDAQMVSQMTELLKEIVASGQGFGAHVDEVTVIGSPGINSDGTVAWFGGSSDRFSIGLWITSATADAVDSDAHGTGMAINEAMAARLAGAMLQELHRHG